MSTSSNSSRSFHGNYGDSISLQNCSRQRVHSDQTVYTSGFNPFNLHNSLDELLVVPAHETNGTTLEQAAPSNGDQSTNVSTGECADTGESSQSNGMESCETDRKDHQRDVSQGTKRQLAKSKPKSRSIVTYLRETFPFKRPIWQTDLTSSSEMSDYDSDISIENNVDGQHCDKDDAPPPDGRSQQHCRQEEEEAVMVQARDVKDSTGSDCSCLDGLGAQGDGKSREADGGEALAINKAPARAMRQARMLARQSAACSSHSLDLVASASGANNRLKAAKSGLFDQRVVGITNVTEATTMVGVTAGEGAPASEQQPSQRGRKSAGAGRVRRPKLGEWPQNSTGFSMSLGTSTTASTTATTETYGRTTSSAYFSDECTATIITGSRPAIGGDLGQNLRQCQSPIGMRASILLEHAPSGSEREDEALGANVDGWHNYRRSRPRERTHHRHHGQLLKQQLQQRRNDHHHHHHYRQNRSHPSTTLSLDNCKCLIRQNLVATLVGAYVLISLAVIAFFMMPYVFNMDSSNSKSVEVAKQEEGGGAGGLIDAATNLDAQKLANLDSDESRLNATVSEWQSLEVNNNGQQQQQQRRKKLTADRLNKIQAEVRSRKGGGGGAPGASYWDTWQVIYGRPCEPLKIPLCGRSLQSMLPESATTDSRVMATLPSDYSMSYDRTLLPNDFTLLNQQQVDRTFEERSQLVDIRCYALMPLFLCSIFAPKCVEVNVTHGVATSVTSLSLPPIPLPLPPQQSLNRTSSWWLPMAAQWSAKSASQANGWNGTSASGEEVGEGVGDGDESERRRRRIGHRSRLVPPCRSFCRDAMRKCKFFLEIMDVRLMEIGSVEDCDNFPESSDERVCVGQRENALLKRAVENQKCRQEEFRCQNGDCIPAKWRCDGFTDCSDKSDEEQCSQCNATSQLYCGAGACISKLKVCDGRIDCKDGRDERLCLRLSSNSTTTEQQLAGDKAHLRRLEAWNATLASWVPVCGANWLAMPMSHEACQALGYTRANETLILYKTPLGADFAAQGNASSSCAFADNVIASERSPPPLPAQTISATATFTANVQSLAGLMSLGVQVGCLPPPSSPLAQNQLVSTVHLSCQGFQCGRSVTSYLSRVTPADQLGPLVSGAAIVTAAQQVGAAGAAAVNEPSATSLGHDARSVHASRLRMPIPTTTTTNDDDDDYNDNIDNGDEEYDGRELLPVSSRLVVGGTESMPGEFPYLAALYGGPDEVFLCGGVLISANWLLTASHCVGNRTQPDGWMVRVGVTRRIASPAFVKKLKVHKIIKHPKFGAGLYLNNDIALLLLAESVEFNQYLRPICLPQSNLTLGPDNSKDCVVVGFGKPEFSQDANYLQVAHFVNVPIVHHSVCSSWYAEQEVTLSDGMLCAGYSDGKRDACQGDSGSGLFCRYSNTNQFFIAGIVSFGINCATAKLPGIYTSVPSYVDWIRETTRNNSFPID